MMGYSLRSTLHEVTFGGSGQQPCDDCGITPIYTTIMCWGTGGKQPEESHARLERAKRNQEWGDVHRFYMSIGHSDILTHRLRP